MLIKESDYNAAARIYGLPDYSPSNADPAVIRVARFFAEHRAQATKELMDALEDIANPHLLPSDGDPSVLRKRAASCLAKIKGEM